MMIKVRDLMSMDIDIDVVDDVTEELYIAFCGAYKLSPEAEEHFSEALNYDAEMLDDIVIIHVDAPGDEWKDRLAKAKELFYSLAGYCDAEDYDKWFEEV